MLIEVAFLLSEFQGRDENGMSCTARSRIDEDDELTNSGSMINSHSNASCAGKPFFVCFVSLLKAPAARYAVAMHVPFVQINQWMVY